jgi:hypothetical protein
MSNNPKCRVLLKDEIESRENVEVFSNNQENGIAFLHDSHPTRKGWDSQVPVISGWGGWYEAGMQIIEAEARLTRKQ